MKKIALLVLLLGGIQSWARPILVLEPESLKVGIEKRIERGTEVYVVEIRSNNLEIESLVLGSVNQTPKKTLNQWTLYFDNILQAAKGKTIKIDPNFSMQHSSFITIVGAGADPQTLVTRMDHLEKEFATMKEKIAGSGRLTIETYDFRDRELSNQKFQGASGGGNGP